MNRRLLPQLRGVSFSMVVLVVSVGCSSGDETAAPSPSAKSDVAILDVPWGQRSGELSVRALDTDKIHNGELLVHDHPYVTFHARMACPTHMTDRALVLNVHDLSQPDGKTECASGGLVASAADGWLEFEESLLLKRMQPGARKLRLDVSVYEDGGFKVLDSAEIPIQVIAAQ